MYFWKPCITTKMMVAGLLLILLFILHPVPRAQATTYEITRTDDPAPDFCLANDCSLREAIIEANSNTVADTIILPAGNYTLSGGSSEDDNALQGDLDITDDLTILGAGSELTSITVLNSQPSRVFDLPRSGFNPVTTTVTIQGITIQNGSTDQEGGGISNLGNLTLLDVVLVDNTATDGGGIFSGIDSTLTVKNSVLEGNQAVFDSTGSSGFGGGIFNYGQATLSNVAVINNDAADSGGGIHNDVFGGSPFLDMTNVTISGNSADNNGGGISNWSVMTLLNVTIADNDNFSTNDGGGFHDTGLAGASFQNTILEDNRNNQGESNCQTTGLSDSNGHNISGDNSCSPILTESSDQNGASPSLWPLQRNGGNTPSMALFPLSPALDSGDNAACPATDQRGVARPRGSDCDVGAYERMPTPTLPACFQPTTISATLTPAVAIPDGDPNGIDSSITLLGPGVYVWDVNLFTRVNHDQAEDVDIYLSGPGLFSPSKMTTDNAGNNLFGPGGVRWDDQALGTVTDNAIDRHKFPLFRGPLAPEGAMAHFIGQNPNGQWLLNVADDDSHTGAGDEGTLTSWSLEVTALSITPTLSSLTTSSSPSTSIPSIGVITDTIEVPDSVGFIADLDVTTHIQHAHSGDLNIRLTSPAGTEVTLTTGNGGSHANVFDGTVWNDQTTGLIPITVADYTGFANNTTASPLVPEGALAAFNGENPGGTWLLSITDDFIADSGSLDSWELSMQLITCNVYIPSILKND